MIEKDKNKEKRRKASLTIEEWLGFFLIPINISRGMVNIFPTDDFNSTEKERFKKFNFDKKLNQSYIARTLGILFYIIIFTIFSFIF